MPAITVSEFLSYIRAFNNQDYSYQHSFYAPRVILALPETNEKQFASGPLQGSHAIQLHYTPLHRVFNEAVVPLEILRNERHVVMIKRTVFQAKDVVPSFCGFAFEKGDVMVLHAWILYNFDEQRRMTMIQLNMEKTEFLGAEKGFKERVEECMERAEEKWDFLDEDNFWKMCTLDVETH
ncbi:hypothetical protein GTA08_BOTSDO00704 [Neofusicoccum parvum]|nr:hypothetical protein GTA08_BOTSDO00704 [Neofusicoccum parvum]